MVRDLVLLKVSPIHPLLRRSAALAYMPRWWHILSIGAQTVAADCILGQESPISTAATVLPLASVFALAEIAPGISTTPHPYCHSPLNLVSAFSSPTCLSPLNPLPFQFVLPPRPCVHSSSFFAPFACPLHSLTQLFLRS